MPPATHKLLSLCCFRRQASGCGGNRYPEKVSQPNCKKVLATLLADVQIIQEQYLHHYGTGHTPVHPGFQGARAQYKRPALVVGIRRRDQPMKVSAPW